MLWGCWLLIFWCEVMSKPASTNVKVHISMIHKNVETKGKNQVEFIKNRTYLHFQLKVTTMHKIVYPTKWFSDYDTFCFIQFCNTDSSPPTLFRSILQSGAAGVYYVADGHAKSMRRWRKTTHRLQSSWSPDWNFYTIYVYIMYLMASLCQVLFYIWNTFCLLFNVF